MASVDVRMRPDEVVTVQVELFVTDIDAVGELLK